MIGKDPLRLAREACLPGDPEAWPVGPKICWMCGYQGATTRDHLIPVSVDWAILDLPSHPGHSPANVAWAHWDCNRKRSNHVTPHALELFHSRAETLPVEWYDGTHEDFLVSVAHKEAELTGRPPFLFVGGPLDGKAPLRKRAIYLDEEGKPLGTAKGDAFRRGRTKLKGIYSRQDEGYIWRTR